MPNDNAPAWPDPARPGVPLNPERDGWHWLLFRDGSRICCWWNASACGWASSDTPSYGPDYLPEEAEQDHVTCEPCLTPSEVTAREAAAAAAMRAACADWHEAQALQLEHSSAKNGTIPKEWILHHRSDASSIRALPIPPIPTQGGNADE